LHVLALAAAAACLTAACAPTPAPDLAIIHVNVLDVRSGRRLADRTVLVEDGRIVSVRPAAEENHAATDARRVVDGRGGLLVPGFVDAHSHLSYLLGDSLSSGGGLITRLSHEPDALRAYRKEYARQYIPYGVTTVRDVGSSEADLGLLVDWMRHPRPDSPDVVPSGGALVSAEAGRIPYPGHRVVEDSADAVATVRAYHELGLESVKLYWRLQEPEFSAALHEARRLDMRPTGHVDFKVLGFERALDLGLRSFEHAYTLGVAALPREDYLGTWREELPAWYGDRRRGRFYLGAMEYFNRLGPDDPRMARLISRLAETGSTVVPTLHVFAQRFGLAPFTSRQLGEFDDLSGLTPGQLEHARHGYRIMADYVRRLYEAGVPLAAGTDWIDPGQAVLSEMWLLHQAGIPMADVLRIGTLGGAEALRLADRIGAVEPGMKADFVLLSRDPLDDPAGLLGPRSVVKDGVVVVKDGPLVGERDAGRLPRAVNHRPAEEHPSPRLAVLVAVDQLGSDVLQRYGPTWQSGPGGTRRSSTPARRATCTGSTRGSRAI
jgi:imidazolonepropionase-like amidohydrolase